MREGSRSNGVMIERKEAGQWKSANGTAWRTDRIQLRRVRKPEHFTSAGHHREPSRREEHAACEGASIEPQVTWKRAKHY